MPAASRNPFIRRIVTPGAARPVCPVTDCTRTRPSGRIMCRPCWAKVTDRRKHQVFTAWSTIRAARDADVVGEVVDRLRQEYERIRDAAIAEAAAA